MLLSGATALSAVAPLGDGPGSVLAEPAHAGPVAPSPVEFDRPAATGATAATADDPAAAVAPPAVRPRPAVTTMSFDQPIQGGLTARQAQRASTVLIAAHDDAAVASAGATWTPGMGRTALARARSWLGMPYSWAGGSASGPTAGRCDVTNGADLDCHIVGFDCSGLTAYAWGAYTGLPHFAQTQRDAGEFHPTVKQLRAGDLVFFSGYLPDGIGHVAIYEGDGMVIEAPQSGAVVRRSTLADLMAHDGTYRGAVRPLTPATPTLVAKAVTVPRAGGAVTVRGAHLAGVTSVTVDGHTRRVANRSDTSIAIAVPRVASGRHAVTVTLSTPWGATSAPVTLAYAAPVAKQPMTRVPVTRAPSTPVPVRTSPEPAPVKPTPVKSTPVKPTPTKSSPPKSSPSPTAPSTPTQSAPAPATVVPEP